MRVAVIGLYRSGSSFWAGCLHHLGIDMGAPFWENDIENHRDNHYEPWDVSIDIRRMWNEPQGYTDWPTEDRVRILREWIENREKSGRICGAKHPLFCLGADDLLAAWGEDTILIWSYRQLDDSVDSLLRTTFPYSELEKYRIQHKFWRASHKFFRRRPADLTLRIADVRLELARRNAIDQIIDRLRLNPTKQQIENAVGGFRITQDTDPR